MGIAALYRVQSGKEAARGTAVAASAKWIGRISPSPSQEWADLERPSLVKSFGAAPTKRGFEADYEGPLTFETPLLHLLAGGIRGGVTPTQPDATGNPDVYRWTFTPLADASGGQQSYTLEFGDDVKVLRATHVLVSEIGISGSAGEALELSASLFGRFPEEVADFTAGLTDPVATLATMAGVKLFVDPAGGSYGTTEVPGTLVSLEVTIGTGLSPVWTAGGLDLQLASEQRREVTITLRGLFRSAWASEWGVFAQGQQRKLRLLVEGPVISGTYKRYVRIDAFGRWRSVAALPPENEDGESVMELEFQTEYDPALAADFQVEVQNTVSSLP